MRRGKTSGGSLKMLTTAEVCDILAIDPRTLSRLISRGDLPAMKITPTVGGQFRFKEKDVLDYIERNQVKPDAQKAVS